MNIWSWHHFVLKPSDSFLTLGIKTTVLNMPQEMLDSLSPVPSLAPSWPVSRESTLFLQYLRCISFCVGHPYHSLHLVLSHPSVSGEALISQTPSLTPPTMSSLLTSCFSFRALVTVELHRLGYMFNVSDSEFSKGRDRGCIHCHAHSAWHRGWHMACSRNLMRCEILSEVFPVF